MSINFNKIKKRRTFSAKSYEDDLSNYLSMLEAVLNCGKSCFGWKGFRK